MKDDSDDNFSEADFSGGVQMFNWRSSFLLFLSEGAPNYFPNSFTGSLDNLKYSPQTVKVNEASCIVYHWVRHNFWYTL